MTNRALLANTKLAQKVAEYVKCKIRGEEYDTSKSSCFVQITCTNPFEISDLHHYIMVKDYTTILQVLRVKLNNPTLTLPSLKGGYLTLLKWNFESRLNPLTNQLEFEIVIEDLDCVGGLGSVEQPENPVSLLEAPGVRALLARLKKHYISQKFNSEHPFDMEAIDQARFRQSEKIRKGVSLPQRHVDATATNSDPFLLYEHNDGQSISQVSQKSDFDVVSITSATQARYGDFIKGKQSIPKRGYSTMPVGNPFDLNLEELAHEQLIRPDVQESQQNVPQEEEQKEETLPNFGGEKLSTTKQLFELAAQEENRHQDKPPKRNFTDLNADQDLQIQPETQPGSKKVKQAGWGVNHQHQQKDFVTFRDKKKSIEVYKSGIDTMDLLNASMGGSLENSRKIDDQDNLDEAPTQELNRPPETRLTHPLMEELEEEIDEDIEDSMKLGTNVRSYFHGNKSSGKQLIQKMMSKEDVPSESSRSLSFGEARGHGQVYNKNAPISMKEKAAQKEQPTMKQKSLKEFLQEQNKTKKQPEKTLAPFRPQQQYQPQPVYHQQQQPQQFYNRAQIQQHQPAQSKPIQTYKDIRETLPQKEKPQPKRQEPRFIEEEEVAEVVSHDYLKAFKPIKGSVTSLSSSKHASPDKLIDLTTQETRPSARASIGKDYLDSFKTLGQVRESPKRLYVDNPLNQASQIDLSEFKMAKPKTSAVKTSSSTVIIDKSPKNSEGGQLKAKKIQDTASDFELLKKMYEQTVFKRK